MSTHNRPVHEIRLAQVRASIWSNQANGSRRWYSVSISRVYRDGDVWKDTTSFGREDLPLVAKAAEMAYAWIWSAVGSHEEKQHVDS